MRARSRPTRRCSGAVAAWQRRRRGLLSAGAVPLLWPWRARLWTPASRTSGPYGVAYAARGGLHRASASRAARQGSPFELEVRPTVFTADVPVQDGRDQCQRRRAHIRNRDRDFRSVSPATTPVDRPSSWRVRIEKLTAVWLGIIGHTKPKALSFNDLGLWLVHQLAGLQRRRVRGEQGWMGGFEEGDDIVFKYDPTQRKIYMRLDRLPMATFEIDIPRSMESMDSNGGQRRAMHFYPLASLSSPNDVVQLAHPGLPTKSSFSRAHGPGLSRAKRDVAAGFIVTAHNIDDIPQPQCNDRISFHFEGKDIVPGSTSLRNGELVDCVKVKDGVVAEEGSTAASSPHAGGHGSSTCRSTVAPSAAPRLRSSWRRPCSCPCGS